MNKSKRWNNFPLSNRMGEGRGEGSGFSGEAFVAALFLNVKLP
jgi:hypothetical protein